MNTRPRKLSATDVHYLSFEGGGGKGAAYLGSLAALAHPAVGLLEHDTATDDYHLRRWTSASEFGIKGVAGSSAGAITASLLASGWGVRALYEDVLSDRTSLAGFFDAADPTHRKIPVARGAGDGSTPQAARSPSCLVEENRGKVSTLESRPAWRWIHTPLRQVVARLTRNPALRQFVESPEGHLRNLWVDYGLFAGCVGHSFLEASLNEGQFVARDGDTDTERSIEGDDRGLTFREHGRRSGIELVLTGTNLRTGRAAYLSDRHGVGQMNVADGVRISMGLPLVFKPVRVSPEVVGRRYEGLWVDGGVLNNNPIHAFDDGSDGTVNEAVLGLRLETDTDNEITDLVSYVKAIGKTYLDAAETREIRTRQEERRTISLPIPAGTLRLLEFAPTDEMLWKAGVESARAVYDYFEVDSNPETALSEVVGLHAS